jgi:L-threonylcarbamoyladenylate synthase
VLAYPTETVYGFGTAVDHESVETLVRLKRRPPYKAVPAPRRGSDMLARLGLHLTATAVAASRRGTGPDRSRWCSPAASAACRRGCAGRGRRGGTLDPARGAHALDPRLRRADHVDQRQRPGVEPAMAASTVLAQWADAIARGTLRVLDGGRIPPSPPSTVVDCTGRVPRVIRPGAIPPTVLGEAAGPDRGPLGYREGAMRSSSFCTGQPPGAAARWPASLARRLADERGSTTLVVESAARRARRHHGLGRGAAREHGARATM